MNSDVDECSTKNGGCSHECINTAGSYKCACPDPELSLTQDNKTCHGKQYNSQSFLADTNRSDFEEP